MGKRQTVNNHIENVNMEIDYNKLAKAIVKAQEMVQDAEKDSEKEHIGFWKMLYRAINGGKSNGKMTMTTFSFITQSMLTIFSIMFGVVALACGLISVEFLKEIIFGSWDLFPDKIICILIFIVSLMLTVLSGLLGIMLFGSANEITYEKDRNYVITILSAVASFSAMVVALVTLFRTRIP